MWAQAAAAVATVAAVAAVAAMAAMGTVASVAAMAAVAAVAAATTVAAVAAAAAVAAVAAMAAVVAVAVAVVAAVAVMAALPWPLWPPWPPPEHYLQVFQFFKIKFSQPNCDALRICAEIPIRESVPVPAKFLQLSLRSFSKSLPTIPKLCLNLSETLPKSSPQKIKTIAKNRSLASKHLPT